MASLHICWRIPTALILFLLCHVVVAQQPDDAYWDTRFGMPGLDDEVRAMAVDGDWLYVGGLFSFAGDIPASRIARWNRVTHVWETLGAGEANGTDGLVMTIAVRGDSVYVGGQFKRAGDKAVENIAVWNKRTARWEEFGQGSGDRYAYVASIVTDAHNVYAGGRFGAIGGLAALNIARWDGTAWQRLGGGLDGYCYAMALDRGKLYVGGTFTTAGTVEAHHVAVWDGTLWSNLGAGLDTNVHALVAGNGSLYAGGIFARSGSDSMSFVARWDITDGTWNALRDTTAEIARTTTGPPPAVYGLALHNDSLFVVGQFVLNYTKGGPSPLSYHVAFWDGQWKTLKSHRDNITRTPNYVPVNAVLVDQEILYFGGKFDGVGISSGDIQPARNLVGWDLHTHQWHVMGRGINNRVTRMVVQGEDLIVSGYFVDAGGTRAKHIARFDNVGWHPFGPGVTSSNYTDGGTVVALFADEKNVYVAGGDLWAFGDYEHLDSANYSLGGAGRWDGKRWIPMPLSDKFPNIGYHPIFSFARANGRLYAGRSGADTPFVDLVRWEEDSGAWAGAGEVYEAVNTLIPDASGNLYLGTAFGLLHWNHMTNTVTRLGTSNGQVRALAMDQERLYVGGDFTQIGGTDAKLIAMYNTLTKQWTALGAGFVHNVLPPRPTVSSIAVANGKVYAGGWFNTTGEMVVNNVAVWDGKAWRPLGSGVDGIVDAIVVQGDDVYLGGNFRNVGGTIPSWHFARWNAAALSVDNQHEESSRAQMILTAVPNPATSRIDFRYTVPGTSRTSSIRLSIYDGMGREVGTVPSPGPDAASWDAGTLPAGVYYCRLQVGDTMIASRLIVVR